MSHCYKLVSVDENKYYKLGTKNQARISFMRLLSELKEEAIVILYSDQDCIWIEDQYEDELVYEEMDYTYGNAGDEKKEISLEKFLEVFNEVAGEKMLVKELSSAF